MRACGGTSYTCAATRSTNYPLHTHGGLVRRLQLDNPPFCAVRAPDFSLSSASLRCVLVCAVPARCFPPLELGDAPNVVGTLALDAHLVRVRGRVGVRVKTHLVRVTIRVRL